MENSEPMKPNCYECQYRGDIPGDAHSRCCHPEVKADSNPFGAMVEVLMGKHSEAARKLGIKGDFMGIRRGWFVWPANFDPTWLVECNGFTPIAKPKDKIPLDTPA